MIGTPSEGQRASARHGRGRAAIPFALLLLALGCASGPRAAVIHALEADELDEALAAYERFREVDGADPELLARIASNVLERAALSEEASERDAAFTQLRLAGRAGERVLERLADREGVSVVRARALGALLRRSHSSARGYLYAMLDSDDPEIRAEALLATDAEADRARLLEALIDASGGVRRVAAQVLRHAAPDAGVRLALAEAARVDPEAKVRASATRSLAEFGVEAIEPLRERLGDPEASVRLSAVDAIVRADRDRGLLAIAPLLGTQTSASGIEAARMLAITEGSPIAAGSTDARAYLRQALVTASAPLRAQAAVALISLPIDPALDEALFAALRAESDPMARLGLARALMRRPGGVELATDALRALLGEGGMPAVQAAALLAARGEEGGLRLLEETLEADSALLRRVAARLLARDARRPDATRAALADEDALVRIHAAGGILAAAHG
ncbi:MAG: HEAT repeat domain-containing protein [Myxococcales bacterium]|nr:HEAT repeat domain-containing protein [Myxococcales bacterium]